MRISPAAYGFDSTFAPFATGPAAATATDRAFAMLAFIFERTNLRIAGGYTTGTGAAWHPLFERLWLTGWGLSLFDNAPPQSGTSRAEFEQFDPGTGHWNVLMGAMPLVFPTEAQGGAHADEVQARATGPGTPRIVPVVPELDRAVVYVDNEDSTIATRVNDELADAALFHELTDTWTALWHELHPPVRGAPPPPPVPLPPPRLRVNRGGFHAMVPFYRGLFRRLEEQPPGAVRVRPGLYAHLNVLGELLAEFPYLYVCDAAYRRGPPPALSSLDPASTHAVPPDRVEWQVSANNAIPQSAPRNLMPATTVARGPMRPWRVWPAVFQFEGTNVGGLFPGRTAYPFGGTSYMIEFLGGGAANWKVDSEASLVDDPAYPSASPRLSMSSGTPCFLSRVDRIDPPAGDTRQGRRVASRFQSNGTDSFAALPLAEHAGALGKVAPGVRARWLRARNEVVLVTPRLTRFDLALETHELQGGTLVAAQPSIATPPNAMRLFVHTSWDAVARTPNDAHVFAVADNGSLLTSHAAPADAWPPLVVQADRAVHQYSELAAMARGEWSVDAFFIGADRALHTSWWNPTLAWPSRTNMAIGNPEILLPTTHLAAVSPNPDTLLVFGVGFDLRLHIASWTSPGPWTAPQPLGGPQEMLAAHTDVAAVWNPARQVCELIAVGNDLTLWLYQIGSTGRSWSAAVPRVSLFAPTSDPQTGITTAAPNPFGDVAVGYSGARIVASVFTTGASQVRFKSSPAMSDPATGPWTDWQAM
jgi:hypothetical protein